MFTGIVSDIGTVESLSPLSGGPGGGVRLRIAAARLTAQLKRDDSVSVNGVCLTVVRAEGPAFDVEAVEVTLQKTTLGGLKPGSPVNLEASLRLGDRLGGHLVLGHVDSVAKITAIDPLETSWLFHIDIPREFTRYLARTGSVTVDGVSLTIAGQEGCGIRISIIPHTMSNTIFQHYRSGDSVNMEYDIVGKYVESLLSEGRSGGEVASFPTLDELRSMGF